MFSIKVLRVYVNLTTSGTEDFKPVRYKYFPEKIVSNGIGYNVNRKSIVWEKYTTLSLNSVYLKAKIVTWRRR